MTDVRHLKAEMGSIASNMGDSENGFQASMQAAETHGEARMAHVSACEGLLDQMLGAVNSMKEEYIQQVRYTGDANLALSQAERIAAGNGLEESNNAAGRETTEALDQTRNSFEGYFQDTVRVYGDPYESLVSGLQKIAGDLKAMHHIRDRQKGRVEAVHKNSTIAHESAQTYHDML